MPDLAHDPLHVEAVGQERDGYVGPPEGVRRDMRQRRHPASGDLLGRERRRLTDDLSHALSVDPSSPRIGDQVVLGSGWRTDPPQAVQVLDHGLDQIRRHLDLADARLGLGVGDAEPRALGIMQAKLADLQVA